LEGAPGPMELEDFCVDDACSLFNLPGGFIPPAPEDALAHVKRQNEALELLFSIPEKSPYWKDNYANSIDDPEHMAGGPMPTNERYQKAMQVAFEKGLKIHSYQQLIRDTGDSIDWFDIHHDSDIAWCWEFSAVIAKWTPLKYLLMHGSRRFVVAPGGHDYRVASLFPGGRLPEGAREPDSDERFSDYSAYLETHVKQGFHQARNMEADDSPAPAQVPFAECVEGPAVHPYGVWHLVPIRGSEYRDLAPLTYDRILCHDRAYEPRFLVDLPLEDCDVEPSEYDDPPRFEPRLYLMLMTGFRRILEGAASRSADDKVCLPSDCRQAISQWLRELKLVGGVQDYLYTRDAEQPGVTFESHLQNTAFPGFLDFIRAFTGVDRGVIRKLEAQGIVSRLDLSLAFFQDSGLGHLKGVGPATAERLKGIAIPPELMHQISSRQRMIEADPFTQIIF